MKHLTLFLLLTLLGVTTSIAQENHLEARLNKEFPRCTDISQNSCVLIQQLVESNKLDSVQVVLNYWKDHCGMNTSIRIMQEMLSIATSGHSLADSTWLQNFNYLMHPRTNFYRWYGRYSYRENPDPSLIQDTEKLLTQLADQRTDLSELDRCFVDFHMEYNKSLFVKLSENKFSGTTIQDQYNNIVNQFKDAPLFRQEFFSGIWIPDGNATKLGLHPVIGVKFGAVLKRWSHDLVGNVKFGNTTNPYSVFKNDSLFTTNHFTGGYIGYQCGFSFIRREKVNLSFNLGTGYDGFSTAEKLNTDNEEEDNSSTTVGVNSYNLNSGLSFRYNWNAFGYLGMDVLYNVVHYNTRGGSNLSGNVLELRLTLGGLHNTQKKSQYQKLGKVADINRYRY